MQAIIFTGLQASGKSSFYRDNFMHTHVRVSLDMLSGSRSKEQKLIGGCIAGKIQCVVDNTNVTAAHRDSYINLFAAAGYDIHAYFFDSVLADCLSRNKKREDRPPLPEVALRTAYKKITVPEIEEGFGRIFLVDVLDDTYGFRVREQSLKTAL